MGKVKPTKLIGLLLSAFCASSAVAGTYNDLTLNNTSGTAADVTAFFSTASSPNIGNTAGTDTSLSSPWVTISGHSNGTEATEFLSATYQYDWYKFTTQSAGTVIVDIDGTVPGGWDSMLKVYNSSLSEVGSFDDSTLTNGAGGSTSGLDAFGEMTLGAGTYYVKVASTGFNPLAAGQNYTLQIQAPVPEPETYAMMLAGLGLMGTIARRRKSSRTVA